VAPWWNANPGPDNKNMEWKAADNHANGHLELPDVHHNVVTWSGNPKRNGKNFMVRKGG